MNRAVFFNDVRASLFGGKLKNKQVMGMEFILDQWDRTGFANRQWLAYALATAFHETAFTMQPIKERGGKAYFTRMYDINGTRPAKARELGNTSPGDGARYAGRGYVQLTGKDNYDRASRALKVGAMFINDPDMVMEPANAAAIMFRGMAEGWFTGKKMSDYINAGQRDYWNARRIINGTDKAGEIADYALRFEAALDVAYEAAPEPQPNPDTITPEPQQHWLTSLLLAIWKAFRR